MDRSVSGFNPANYSNLSLNASNISPNTTYTPLINITGKQGLLMKALVNQANGGNGSNFRITIDGVQKSLFNTLGTAPGPAFGIITNPNDKMVSQPAAANSTTAGYMPQGGGLTILTEPIYFKNSLLIEAANTVAGNLNGINYEYCYATT